MHWGNLWRDFLSGDADAVAAVGTWATVAVAVGAALLVVLQLRTAARARWEEAQPDVVAIMESNPNQPEVIEFAIRNFGPTPARNVTVESSPPMRRTTGSGGTVEAVWFPTAIPYLAPGQEWRTTWDFAYSRMNSELEEENLHRVVIRFDENRGGGRRETTADLDWSAYKGRRYLRQRSIHHAASALMDIQKSLRSVMDGTGRRRRFRVLGWDGEAEKREEREYFAQLDAKEAEEARAARIAEENGDVTSRFLG
ncbi:hypothetical protein [Cellulomonas sp. C5510]|uniref:hypothetical protein n=1 Tax=Cellulomonas sp. C5510 TaxID=2871170 RepID=UPI001C93C530|nr:hypothetical protein [Cellulomonas sp. C5510]QZN86900.1 hypothetical protein K5O09_07255 [Cellulomonas sp. C5510]